MRATLETIESGAPGLRRKLDRMRELVGAAVRDPDFRARTAAVIRDVPEKDHDGEIRAIVDHVRGGIRYMRDPYDPDGLELFVDPQLMLADVDAGTAAGDCDDHVLLAASMLGVAGYPNRFAVGGVPPDDYRHIWVDVMHPRRGWLPIELTSKRMAIGADPSGRFPLVEKHAGWGVGMLGDDDVPSGWHNRAPASSNGALPSDRYRRADMLRDPPPLAMLPSDRYRRADVAGEGRPMQLPGRGAGSWIPRPRADEFPNAPAVDPFSRPADAESGRQIVPAVGRRRRPFARPVGGGGAQIVPRVGEPMIRNSRQTVQSGTLGAFPSFQSLVQEFEEFVPLAQQFAPLAQKLLPGLSPYISPFLPAEPEPAAAPPPLPSPPPPPPPPPAGKVNPTPIPQTPRPTGTIIVQPSAPPPGAPAPLFGGVSPMMLGLGALAALLLLGGGGR